MRFAIIDESGRLYDPNDRFLVFAAVVVESLVNLDKIIPAIKKNLPRKKKLAEIKFSTTGEKTRIRVLNKIYEIQLKLFVLVIDKQGRKIQDSPENYALLISTLIKKVLAKYSTVSHIIIDRHFTWVTQLEKFNDLVQKELKRQLFIEHLDSQQNTVVSLPDFVAGAERIAHNKNEPKYVQIINKQVDKRIITTWRELKRKKVKV